MRLHVSDSAEADAAWRMLDAVPDDLFQPVELHISGLDLVLLITRAENGDQLAAPAAAGSGRSSPA